MDRTAQTIKLKDGRRLGFAEYGDPKGKPLFYFHGWPASRISAEYYDSLAKKLHVRIIAPDRPGFGISQYKKDRTLLDWPDDVVALANYLKIKKFAVMGVSGGGPYAAVCAYKIPVRLTNVGIVVGLGPIRGPESLKGVLWISKFGWQFFGRHPRLRRISTFLHFINVKYNIIPLFNQFVYGKEDRKLFRDPILGNRLTNMVREAFRQGYKGPELDLKLYTNDWGFDLCDVQVETYLWYADKDRSVSLAMGKYYVSQIHGSKLKVYPGEGHLISVTHADEILKTLVL